MPGKFFEGSGFRVREVGGGGHGESVHHTESIVLTTEINSRKGHMKRIVDIISAMPPEDQYSSDTVIGRLIWSCYCC